MKTKTVMVIVPVIVPEDLELDAGKIAGLVDQMLDVGYADAVETADDPDLNNPDAEIIAQLEIETPYESANPGT